MKNTRKNYRNKIKSRTKKMKRGGNIFSNIFSTQKDTLDNDIKTLDKDITTKQNEIDDIENKIIVIRTKINNKRPLKQIDEDINRLEKELNNSITFNDYSFSNIMKINKVLVDLNKERNEFTELQGQFIDDKQDMINGKKNEIKNRENQIKQYEQQIKFLQKYKKENVDNKINKIKSDEAELKSSANELQTKREFQRNNITALIDEEENIFRKLKNFFPELNNYFVYSNGIEYKEKFDIFYDQSKKIKEYISKLRELQEKEKEIEKKLTENITSGKNTEEIQEEKEKIIEEKEKIIEEKERIFEDIKKIKNFNLRNDVINNIELINTLLDRIFKIYDEKKEIQIIMDGLTQQFNKNEEEIIEKTKINNEIIKQENELKNRILEVENEINETKNKKNGFVEDIKKIEDDKFYKKYTNKSNENKKKILDLNNKKTLLEQEIKSKKKDKLIKESQKNLIFYLQQKHKSSENLYEKSFTELVDLATNKNVEKLQQVIEESQIEQRISPITKDEVDEIIKYYNDNKINSTIKKIKKILADFLASKEKEKNPNITHNELINKYKSLLKLDYDELKYQAKNYDINLKKIIKDQIKPNINHIIPGEIEEITEQEIDLAINAKEKRTTYESIKNALTTDKGIVSGISSISKGIVSGIGTLFHDPNAKPKPKHVPKIEVFMGTETTDYKHPLDGTNVGDTYVYKSTNSPIIDSIKGVDNFMSRMQEDVLNSSEKDPLQIKKPEKLFKNKDTKKRLAVFHPLNDRSINAVIKKGGKAKRNTQKRTRKNK
jgi:hypothetical protein